MSKNLARIFAKALKKNASQKEGISPHEIDANADIRLQEIAAAVTKFAGITAQTVKHAGRSALIVTLPGWMRVVIEPAPSGPGSQPTQEQRHDRDLLALSGVRWMLIDSAASAEREVGRIWKREATRALVYHAAMNYGACSDAYEKSRGSASAVEALGSKASKSESDLRSVVAHARLFQK